MTDEPCAKPRFVSTLFQQRESQIAALLMGAVALQRIRSPWAQCGAFRDAAPTDGEVAATQPP
ncbi:MAG: hypothetical protein ABI360_06180 [Allobranchiibius sp.]